MPDWMLKVHLYGGLLCFWYLIIFGISALFFQHHFSFMQNKDEPQGFARMTLPLNEMQKDGELSLQLMDTLDLAGWHLPWLTYRDSLGTFHTQVENPKMTYRIRFNTKSGILEIDKSYKGLWHVVNSMHALGQMPGAPFLIFWKIYTYICFIVVLFSIVSGICLWSKKKTDRKAGWTVFSIALAGSLFLMFYIYYFG